ncbi:class C sortase [Mediterraneibacter sp. 210702-DFI.5.30]|uniref:class C sortase n=1 Tax=Mediterraneibacter sp. 210702-DFI.5.30 TaxID=2883232 RepID=UPI001D08D63A|nr:class C sortase [Mediterraneibacter sp. 210702-DFI.5.30]MCB6621422.1 class C sortase [Mediterraneibacter sp. 210702-DFI.5.30]
MKKIRVIFCVIIFMTGLGIASYPFISNMVAQRHASQVVKDYETNVEEMDEEKIDAMKEAAKKYNEQLSNVVSVDDENENNEQGESYADLLNIGESLGYITIPKINVNLPIYNGTSQDVLSKGVGHMEQSSYPLGGESTHCVLTGHRGLPSAVLFTDLDKLEIGDEFYLHVLDEILAYKVDQIKVVEPNESGDLEIIDGKDYCTLVTCTPYAINSHRLLVRGERTEYKGEQDKQTKNQMQTGALTKRIVDVWPWLLGAFLVAVLIESGIFFSILKRKKQDMEE